MTPALLLAILALLAFVLIGLGAGLLLQIRSGRPSLPKRGKGHSVKDKKQKGNAAPISTESKSKDLSQDSSETLPRVVGRKRKLLPVSSGGGDESAAKRLLQSGAYASCEERLELAFESFAHGRISLDTYETMVRVEGERADRLQAELRARELAGNTSHAELDSFREEIETIRIAVKWCLDWSDARRAGSSKNSDSS